MCIRSCSRAVLVLLTAVAVLTLCARAAHAQVHEVDFGRYTVRANLASSMSLPAGELNDYGLLRADDQAVLSVVVLDDTADVPGATVPVRLKVQMRRLAGSSHDIEMHAAVANDRVSYLGNVPIRGNRMTAHFSVTVRPSHGEPMTMHFAERLYSRR